MTHPAQKIPDPPAPDSARVVVLGASNVAIALSQVLQSARRTAGRPCRFHIAAGHGRSYVKWSSLLVRQLPGLKDCELWASLKPESGSPLYALVTDIGNDLGYGVPVLKILDHLQLCLDRLHNLGAQIVVTELPEESLQRVQPWRYKVFRSLFFPGNRSSLADMLKSADQIQNWLNNQAGAGSFTLVHQPGRWFGFDPIHLRRSVRAEAFAEFFKSWNSAATPDEKTPLHLPPWPLRPAHRRFFGREQRQVQPVRQWTDGSSLSLF